MPLVVHEPPTSGILEGGAEKDRLEPLTSYRRATPEAALLHAMLGVYEQRSVAVAVELFETTYRRSTEKYRASLGAFGAPDPIRARYREALGDAIRRVVSGGEWSPAAIASRGIEPVDLDAFTRLVEEELAHLAIYNRARYRLASPAVERWTAAGRPGIDHDASNYRPRNTGIDVLGSRSQGSATIAPDHTWTSGGFATWGY